MTKLLNYRASSPGTGVFQKSLLGSEGNTLYTNWLLEKTIHQAVRKMIMKSV